MGLSEVDVDSPTLLVNPEAIEQLFAQVTSANLKEAATALCTGLKAFQPSGDLKVIGVVSQYIRTNGKEPQHIRELEEYNV